MPDTGTIVGESGLILRTTDGGQTWVSQVSGATETLLAVTMTAADQATAVGQLGTILTTTDGGASWTRQESGTNQDLYDVAFPEATIGTAVGGFGAILRTVGSDADVCPQRLAYWKNQIALWPVDALELGSQTYGKDELREILRSAWRADASLILAGQLIAAKLNLANGSDPAPVADAIAEADELLGDFDGKLPYGVKRGSETGRAMVDAAETLRSYNHGELTPDCTP